MVGALSAELGATTDTQGCWNCAAQESLIRWVWELDSGMSRSVGTVRDRQGSGAYGLLPRAVWGP